MILKRAMAAQIIEELKRQNKKVVFTNGCFDILHVGHLSYLNDAKKQGDILIVGVNSDMSVKRLKGESRPINSEVDRAEDTPCELLDELKPSIHVKGGDYTKDELPETKIVERNGGEVRILGFVEGKSTTNIVNKIQG